MTKESNEHLDPALIDHDPRNVIDAFKGWKVEAVKAYLATTAFPVHVAIENFQHDYNIGTIVRNANAFNVSSVHIIGKRHWNRRGAMATEKYITLEHHQDVDAFSKWASEHNITVVGVDNIANSTPMEQASLPKNSVYIFGQEGPGLSKDMQQTCTQIIKIEQYGSTRSINVGVASGIVLYEWVKRYLA